jgi:hypothetical protein
MAAKKKYTKLDDLDFVGTQEKISPAYRKRMERITGEIFRQARLAASKKKSIKKPS